MSLIIRPVTKETNLTANAQVKSAIGYPKLDIKEDTNSVPLEISFVSSEESNGESGATLMENGALR